MEGSQCGSVLEPGTCPVAASSWQMLFWRQSRWVRCCLACSGKVSRGLLFLCWPCPWRKLLGETESRLAGARGWGGGLLPEMFTDRQKELPC